MQEESYHRRLAANALWSSLLQQRRARSPALHAFSPRPAAFCICLNIRSAHAGRPRAVLLPYCFQNSRTAYARSDSSHRGLFAALPTGIQSRFAVFALTGRPRTSGVLCLMLSRCLFQRTIVKRRLRCLPIEVFLFFKSEIIFIFENSISTAAGKAQTFDTGHFRPDLQAVRARAATTCGALPENRLLTA